MSRPHLHVIQIERRRKDANGVYKSEGANITYVQFSHETDEVKCGIVTEGLKKAIFNSPGKDNGDLQMVALFDNDPIPGAKASGLSENDFNANQDRVTALANSWRKTGD